MGNPSLIWHGTNSSNIVNLTKANIGVAFFPGDTASMTTLRTGYVSNKNSDVTLTVGAGASISTLDMNGGTVTINNGATTATVSAGTLTCWARVASPRSRPMAAPVIYNATGTLGTAIVSESGSLDFSQDPRPKTVTNPIQLYGNSATLNDPNQVVSSLVVDLEQSDNLANVALGTNIKLTRSTPP